MLAAAAVELLLKDQLEVLVDLVGVEMVQQLEFQLMLVTVRPILAVAVEEEIMKEAAQDVVVPVVPVSSSSHTHHKTSKTLLKPSHTPPQGPTRHRIISR
jgi:hypothetical protein